MSSLEDLVKDQLPDEPELSFSRSDIEKRISFPAGRFTSPGPLLAPLVALLAAAVFYGVMAIFPGRGWSDMFTQRGPVPYVIVYFSCWASMLLIIKDRKLALQRKALDMRLIPPDDPSFSLTPKTAKKVLETVYGYVDDPNHFLLTRRIHYALSNLQNMGRIGDVDEVLRTQSENDEAQVDSSYTVLAGFIWAIPVLGFIGTVLGLSLALGSFGDVLNSASEMEQLRSALQEVTGGLSTAFETTLQGLVATLCIHMFMISVKRKEEAFLDDCKDYCQKYIVGRLRLVEPRA